MRSEGFTLPWNDLLIATLTLEKDVAVYANDRYCEPMAEHLRVRLYQPSYNGAFNQDH